MIATSAYSSCGLRRDGTVACWGAGDYFLTGSVPDGADSSTPVDIPQLEGITAISAGFHHVCARQRNGDVLCWGWNDEGLGDGTLGDPSPIPVRVRELPRAIAIDSSIEHSCAIVRDGRVFCWGEGRKGMLGDGMRQDRLLPVQVEGIEDAVSIGAGYFHTCVALGDGSVRCWGSNSSGQLGDGTLVDSVHPVRVEGIDDAVEISSGTGHNCARLSDATVRCWGNNYQGQIGSGALPATGHADFAETRPVQVVSLAGVVALGAGGDTSCALLATGKVACWGSDHAGQLGAGLPWVETDDPNGQPAPVEVIGLVGATSVSESPLGHACALLTDGTAMCWGLNDDGQLGDGGPIRPSESRVPVAVVGFDIDGRP